MVTHAWEICLYCEDDFCHVRFSVILVIYHSDVGHLVQVQDKQQFYELVFSKKPFLKQLLNSQFTPCDFAI